MVHLLCFNWNIFRKTKFVFSLRRNRDIAGMCLSSQVAIFLIISGAALSSATEASGEENEECLQDIDLILLLDGSYSVTKPNFELIKHWIKSFAEGMHIGHGHIQLGVVQYSHYYPKRLLSRQRYIRTEIGLGQYTDKVSFDAAVDSIKYQGYKTYTAHAINKTLRYDFLGPKNRYPKAKRILVLLTDGKATDSSDLPSVVAHAVEKGVVMYTVGVGEYDVEELHLISGNHAARIFELTTFTDLESIVEDLQFGVRTACDCDVDGSLHEECHLCTRECTCKANVVGRRCDSCAAGHYGLRTGDGCQPCGCNPYGTDNTSFCDVKTGQCQCSSTGLAGRRCDQCAEGYFGFPQCRPCRCNGFSSQCDQNTGICQQCSGRRTGDQCESCEPGFFSIGIRDVCAPCGCNNNINSSDLGACDAKTGECLRCLHNTTGKHCEKCDKFYYGNALNRTCKKCQCDTAGTDSSGCNGDDCICNVDGSCKCLVHAAGVHCEMCASNFWKRNAKEKCIECLCDKTGTESKTICDQKTGKCVCKDGYAGKTCSDCGQNYIRSNPGDECVALADVSRDSLLKEEPVPDGARGATTTTTTSTKATTISPSTTSTVATKPTSKSNSRLRVNPGWSPCTSCHQRWPSYCRGWTCRTRWPYHYQTPSPRRCYSGSWSCRASVSRYYSYGSYPTYNNYGYWNAPSYYRGYYHHRRRYNSYHSKPVRYNLYKTHRGRR